MNEQQENQSLENAVEELDDDMLAGVSGGMRPAANCDD